MPKLLIVDDELDVREFAKNFFKRRKIEVTTAESGELALDALSKDNFDLVILDVRMGGIDGIETLRRLRQSGNKIDVIMVTGADDDETTSAAKNLGVVGYIHKPLILDELEKVVMQRLQKK